MKMTATNQIYRKRRILFRAVIACIMLLHLQTPDVSAAVSWGAGRRPTIPQPKPPPSSSLNGTGGEGSKRINNSVPIPGLGQGIPNYILGEIRSLDQHLKCFPKLLCTIYQDNTIVEKMGSLNATELGVAYIKLLKAVHYTSPVTMSTTTESSIKAKRPIIQIFQIPAGLITASTYSGRKDHHSHHLDDLEDYPHHLSSPLADDYEDDDDILNDYTYDYLGNNPRRDVLDDNDVSDEEREFLRERLEITQMMQDSKEEDNADANKEFSTSATSAGTKLATTLLSSFLPFLGSRSIKKRSVVDWNRMEQLLRNNGNSKGVVGERMRQEPFWRAVNLWRRLEKRSQCKDMYESCPFEAWEIVRMLDLVNGQSQILAAYLKITVDNVKPLRLRH